jgi:hypothetical protein
MKYWDTNLGFLWHSCNVMYNCFEISPKLSEHIPQSNARRMITTLKLNFLIVWDLRLETLHHHGFFISKSKVKITAL